MFEVIMSNNSDKIKNSIRRFRDETAVKKQQKIAKQFGLNHNYQPHRWVKHHALNCGNPRCLLCKNPRKTFKELTAQERKIFQDIDRINNKHSNGLNKDQNA
jgi:F420-0:gamma-glutamyl ligase-like protein